MRRGGSSLKPEYIVLLISLALTSLVSIVFGFTGSTIIGNFWGWFFISFLLQIIIFVLWNSYVLGKQSLAEQQLEVQALENFAKFTVNLDCAYCQQKNLVPIQLNQKNTFKCESCNQVNGVYMQFMATTITTPLESVSLPVNDEKIEIKLNQS